MNLDHKLREILTPLVEGTAVALKRLVALEGLPALVEQLSGNLRTASAERSAHVEEQRSVNERVRTELSAAASAQAERMAAIDKRLSALDGLPASVEHLSTELSAERSARAEQLRSIDE